MTTTPEARRVRRLEVELDADTIDRLTRELADARADAEREHAWHDRVLKSAQAIFGEDAIRYKLSLFKNGRARNYFPSEMDGHWFAFQRAENDGHMGLVAMLEAARAEAEVAREEALVLHVQLANKESARQKWAAEAEAMRADARRFRALIDTAPGCLCFQGQDYRTGDEFRAAIDTAMGAGEA